MAVTDLDDADAAPQLGDLDVMLAGLETVVITGRLFGAPSSPHSRRIPFQENRGFGFHDSIRFPAGESFR